MVDIASIGAALGSLKTASDLVKLLKESSVSLEKADFQFKLAELIESLADARIQMAEVKESLIAKDQRIAELEETFKDKDHLMRYEDAYYLVSERDMPTGPPFCAACWEAHHKKRQLLQVPGNHHTKQCGDCKHVYLGDLTRYMGRPPSLG